MASLHRQAGLRVLACQNPILQLAKRDIWWAYTAPTSAPHKPITSSVLADLLAAILRLHSLYQYDCLVLSAYFTLAFFGFLCIRELAVPSRRLFDQNLHPMHSSIWWANNHFTFHPSHSKTNQFLYHLSIHISVSGPSLSIPRHVSLPGLTHYLQEDTSLIFRLRPPLHMAELPAPSLVLTTGIQPPPGHLQYPQFPHWASYNVHLHQYLLLHHLF